MANRTSYTIIGEKVIAAAGTAEQLLDAIDIVKEITIKAKATNTGNVYIGNSDIDSTVNDGIPANEGVIITKEYGMNIREFFIDVDNNGEGVDFYGSYL